MRFFRIYKIFVAQKIKMLMEYRVDFLTGATSFLITQLTNLVFIGIIFGQIPHLNGFLFQEIIFIYGFSLMSKGLDHLLTDNFWKLAYFVVRKGDFDKYLTRPIDPLVHVIIENIEFDALGEFITGIVLFIISSRKLKLHFGPLDILLLIIAVIFGAMIFTAIKIIGAAIAFWIQRSGSILQIFYGTSDFARYPTTIYNAFVKNLITYIIPFAFTSYYPAVYFLRGENPLFNIGGVVVAAVILLLISICVWNRGLSAYESAGS